ncbi:MAG: metal-dependent transcriptional regulator [Halobacteriota archaeon]
MAVLSPVMEDYLKAIYHLQAETDGRVATSAIAEHLGVTPPTVTSMLESLEERDLVDREKYEGVRLTTAGERVALEVIRHHRLLEAYLTEHLDFDWSEVHEEADRLEHHISEALEARVAEALADPEVDPHGSPIPGADLEPPTARPGTALLGHDPGTRVEVVQVPDEDPTVLEYLAAGGVEPGRTLTVEGISPVGVVSVATADGEAVALSEEVAASIRVRPIG